MSYSPNNTPVYLAAFAGAIAGLGATAQPVVNASYYAQLADAFAQEVDTLWGANNFTQVDLLQLEESAEEILVGRAPPLPSPLVPGTWFSIAQDVITLTQAGTAQIVAQGINPNDTTSNPTALKQAVWWIDPIDGNDDNDGLTLATALKTWAELNSRWGVGNLLTPLPLTPTFVGPLPVVTVNTPNGLLPTDLINMNVALQAGGFIRVVGASTVVRSGTAVAVTVLNRTNVPNPGGTPWSIADAGIVAGDVNNIIQWTSGAANGAFTWGAKNTSEGNLRLSDIQNVCPFPGSFYVGQAPAPSPGDTYNVLSLASVTLGAITISYQGNPGAGADSALAQGGLYFELLHSTFPAGGTGNFSIVAPKDVAVSFNRCKLDNTIEWMDGRFYGLNCGYFGQGGEFTDGGVTFIASDFSQILGGLVNTSPGTGVFAGTVVVRAGRVNFDGDVLFQSTALVVHGGGGIGEIGQMGVFDAPSTGEDTSGAVTVGTQSAIVITPFFAGTALYGNGNAGVGASALPGGSIIPPTAGIASVNITGTGGDFEVGLEKVNLWGFNITTGLYVGPTPASWANLAAPLAAGTGFGGHCINPQKLSNIGTDV